MRFPGWDKIFHPTDLTHGDEGALAHALKLALLSKAELDLVHTGPGGDEVSWNDFPKIRKILERWSLIDPGATHKEVRDMLGLEVKKIRKKSPDVVESIVEQIQEHDPNLVVLATHQRQGLHRLTHKAVAEPVARKAGRLTLFVPRSVEGFVSRATGDVRFENVIVPIDHLPRPQLAVDAAVEFAETLRATAVRFALLYVGKEGEMPEVTTPDVAGWNFERSAWQGNVVEHILAVGKEQKADLIVMSTHGHDGFLDAVRGSTTERVLRGAKCPVLATRA